MASITRLHAGDDENSETNAMSSPVNHQKSDNPVAQDVGDTSVPIVDKRNEACSTLKPESGAEILVSKESGEFTVVPDGSLVGTNCSGDVQVHGERIILIPKWLRHYSDASPSTSSRMRVYQVWPGKNVFFFRGHIICGPDPRGFVLTAASIVLSCWIFLVYVGDSLPEHRGIIVFYAIILTVIVLMSLMMVATKDPGIIPRNENTPLEEVGTSHGTRSKEITVNGIEVKIKYCKICKFFRPPRSCHCSVCDNCVEKFDHHCPWIGQCIGLRNYRYYVMLLLSALVLFIYIFSFSWWRIGRISKTGSSIFRTLKCAPETFALALFSFVSICFLGGLAVFHAHLIALNQTARENFKQRYTNSWNPYDKGILSNIREALFVSLPPSKVNFRAELKANGCSNGDILKKANEAANELEAVAIKSKSSEM